MQTSTRWTETAEAVDDVPPPIHSISYSPSGDYVVVACGIRVLVYAASTGTLLHSLKGHDNTVYCVQYTSDGKFMASGGADCLVVIWSDKGEGVLMYKHQSSIQALASNPVRPLIASISNADFGIWAPDVKGVDKHALPAKGLCGTWTPDGQTLAIGLLDGTVLLLDGGVEERHRIHRNAPVWALAFNPIREDGVDILIVGSWDQRLSFYHVDGSVAYRERDIGTDPCSISFFSSGEYLLIGGTDRKVALYTKDGCKLVDVVDADDWVWSASGRPRQMQICYGTHSGTIACVNINLTKVHCIFQDQYAHRENMTEVVVHQLTLDRQMRIPCNEYIKRLATYRGRLAVHFQERIVIFEVFYDDERNMRYQDIAQIRKRLDCTLMCVTTSTIVLCQDRRLTMYDFQGSKRREWFLDSSIRFAKTVGGYDKREVLLVGLSNGQALKIFLDNPFPTVLLKIDASIQFLDLSASRTKLAVVDENNILHVFSLSKKNELLFTEPNVNAAAWNTEYDDMIAFSTTNNMLHIKYDMLPAFQQVLRGVVVGFKANRVFHLHNKILVMGVPHSHALYRYIEQKEFESAYKVASLGVADADWKMLGMHAMMHMHLDLARRAFTRTHDVKLVELLNRLELQRRQGAKDGTAVDDGLLMGHILAYQGKFQDAARQFVRSNREDMAIDVFCDLKMWEEAKKVCSDQNHLNELIRQQARWAEDSKNYIDAASLYETCGDYARAIRMLGLAGQVDRLMAMCRTLPKSEVALITECASYFRQNNAIPYALEAYDKVGDNRALISMYVAMGDWRSAFGILAKCPQLSKEVYVPWAMWLAENDQFEKALEAFRAARWPRETVRMMETLASNSVTCRKFRDAAFYCFHLATEYGQFDEDEVMTDALAASRIKRCNECVRRAEIYYAYNTVYVHTTQPFPFMELNLFRTTRYLLAMLSEGTIPLNVGKAEVLYTLARVSNRVDMVRTARAAFEKLQHVILPLSVMEQVDVETLAVRGRSFTDREELLDVCYRCKQTVPQLTDPGDRCPLCFHPFVRSFVNFESLPLVEFVLSNDVKDEVAERIIMSGLCGNRTYAQDDDHAPDEEEAGMSADGTGPMKPGNEWKSDNGANVITFGEDNIDYQIDQQLMAMGRVKAAANKHGDPFVTQLQYITRPGRPKGQYQPFVANADLLKTFRCDDVFIVKPRYGSLPVPNRYYRVMDKKVSMVLCNGCQHFFLSEAYEYERMKGEGCPFCRYKPDEQVERTLRETMLVTTTVTRSEDQPPVANVQV